MAKQSLPLLMQCLRVQRSIDKNVTPIHPEVEVSPDMMLTHVLPPTSVTPSCPHDPGIGCAGRWRGGRCSRVALRKQRASSIAAGQHDCVHHQQTSQQQLNWGGAQGTQLC